MLPALLTTKITSHLQIGQSFFTFDGRQAWSFLPPSIWCVGKRVSFRILHHLPIIIAEFFSVKFSLRSVHLYWDGMVWLLYFVHIIVYGFRFLRTFAYRWIVRWLCGYMGWSNRRPLSACIYLDIRTRYQTLHKQSTGYANRWVLVTVVICVYSDVINYSWLGFVPSTVLGATNFPFFFTLFHFRVV